MPPPTFPDSLVVPRWWVGTIGHMDRDDAQGMEDPHEARSVERGSLHELADASRDATYGETGAGRAWVPGVISGDLGPKGKVSAQLRDLSRAERSRLGEVPRGMQAPGTGRYVLGALLLVVAALVGLIALFVWLAS